MGLEQRHTEAPDPHRMRGVRIVWALLAASFVSFTAAAFLVWARYPRSVTQEADAHVLIALGGLLALIAGSLLLAHPSWLHWRAVMPRPVAVYIMWNALMILILASAQLTTSVPASAVTVVMAGSFGGGVLFLLIMLLLRRM